MTLKQRKALYTALTPILTLLLAYLTVNPNAIVTWEGAICAVIVAILTYFIHGFSTKKANE